MRQIINARAVIKQEQKILLLRRAQGNPLYVGLYELPGGKVEFGEDPKASLQREIFEETDVEVDTMQLFDVYSYLDTHDEQKQYILLIFIATLMPGKKINPQREHNKYSWKKMSDIQLSEITDITRVALQIEQPMNSIGVKEGVDDVVITTNNEQLVVYADGGSRGNPGPSASGFVIKDPSDTRLLFEGGKYLGITTNNQAEYQAVKLALEKALEMGGRSIQCRLDSLLVVNQLNGIYKIRNRDLWPIHAYIKDISQKFEHISFTHVRREFNKEADAMVNKILDQQQG